MAYIQASSSTTDSPCINAWRSLHLLLGFKKGYNFSLFIVLNGALLGFILARLKYLDCIGATSTFIRSTTPVDAINYLGGYKRIGIILHLFCILLSGFFACWQFVPVIRYKVLLLHRLNGYLVILLLLTGTAGACMTIPSSLGGILVTRAALGLLGALSLVSICFAYYNIKILRIDRHREWMIRTWVYAATVISLRLIMMAANHHIKSAKDDSWYVSMSCSDIWQQYTLVGVPDTRNPTPLLYPRCTGADSTAFVSVSAHAPGPEGISAMYMLTFPVGLVLGLFLHVFGVEMYFWMTPGETERLRKISRERRIEAGLEQE